MIFTPKCIHRGFDGLDVSFIACLQPDALEHLRSVRKAAEAAGGPKIVRFGPGNFGLDLAETGARGGYKFRGDSGHLGATWFIKDRSIPEPGNIRVSVHSETLAHYGLQRVERLLALDLESMGATVAGESISRVDFAIDFRVPKGFHLEVEQFVSHSRATVREHSSASEGTLAESAQIIWRGRKVSSITIGKMPGRQLIVYDKRSEVITKHKEYWFDIWKIKPSDLRDDIWRVETRFGKAYLAERARLYTYIDLSRSIQSLLSSSLEAVRYLARQPNGENVSRVPDHVLWKAARDEISRAFDSPTDMPDIEMLIEKRRRRSLAHRRQMVAALMPGIVALEGYTAEEGRQIASDIAAECARSLAIDRPRLFLTKSAEALERLNLRRSS